MSADNLDTADGQAFQCHSASRLTFCCTAPGIFLCRSLSVLQIGPVRTTSLVFRQVELQT